MMEINFRFKEDYIIKCKGTDLVKDICLNFAKKHSLDTNKIFFIYEGKKLNLELDLYVSQQFDFSKDNKSKRPKRVEIFVCEEETPFYVKFLYKGNTLPLNVKETDRMKVIFQRFCSEVKMDIKKIYFLYNSQAFFYSNIGTKTVNDLVNNIDRNGKVMTITVYEIEKDQLISEKNLREENLTASNMDSVVNSELHNKFVPKKLKDSHYKRSSKKNEKFSKSGIVSIIMRPSFNINKKYNNLKNTRLPIFAILLGQYALILSLFSFRFLFEFNIKKHPIIIFSILGLTEIICVIMCLVLVVNISEQNEDKRWYIYHILYIPIVLIHYYLISYFMNKIYIFSFICLINVDLLLIAFYICIFEKDSLNWIFVTLLISNILIMIALYFLLIKNIKKTIYFSLISLAIIIYLLVLSYLTKKYFNLNKIFSVMLFDYVFFMIMYFIILLIFECLRAIYDEICNKICCCKN